MSSAPFLPNPLSIESEYQNLCDKLELFENQMKVSESRIFSYGMQLSKSFKTKSELLDLHNLPSDKNIIYIIDSDNISILMKNDVILFAFMLCNHDFYTPVDPGTKIAKITECLKC